MRTIKSISPEANQLREKFQKLIVDEYIKDNGSLRGYKGQLYILLPKYDKKTTLYRGVNRNTYDELYAYLFSNQSQRRFNTCEFINDLKCRQASQVNLCKDFGKRNCKIEFYKKP